MKRFLKKVFTKRIHRALRTPLVFLTHDLSIRSTSEKIIQSSYYGRYDDADKLLKRELDRYLDQLPIGYRSGLLDSLANILNSGGHIKSHETIQKHLIEITSDLNALSVNERLWLDLQYVAIRFGMFQWSGVLRNKALEASIHSVKSRETKLASIVSAFKGALDQSCDELALNILNGAANKMEEQFREKMLFYYTLCLNNNYASGATSPIIDQNDKFYLDFIKGKSIAIVGPAVTGENNGEEIDSHDVVVRLGYKGKKFIGELEKVGSRSDISYYSNGNAGLYISRKESEFLRDLEWAVFKSRKYMGHASEINAERKRCFVRNEFYFCGSPTMMQNATFDILNFKPIRVKLFNINFNCAEVRHYKEYLWSQEEWKIFLGKREHIYYRIWKDKPIDTGGFAHHDLLSQLNFIRNLWKNKIVEVDCDCERVLKMSNEEYLMEMERLHVRRYLEDQ